MTKILFMVGEGIGNQAETIPAFNYCKRKYGHIDVCNSIPNFIEATEVIFKGLADRIFTSPDDVPLAEYDGQIVTAMAKRIEGLDALGQAIPSRCSEVEQNMGAVGCDFTNEELSNFGSALNYISMLEDAPDIILHDGYSKLDEQARERWKAKSYPYYIELAKRLTDAGLIVGSIGSKDEYIEGTIDLTGRKLADSLSAIKGCRLFICNATGTFHLACIMGIKTLSIWTFTDLIKNYDERFHKTASIMRRELPCSPCQYTMENGDFWLVNKLNCRWRCREMEPDIIARRAMEMLS